MKKYFGFAIVSVALLAIVGCGSNATVSPAPNAQAPGAPVRTLALPQVQLVPTSLSFFTYVGSTSASAPATLTNVGTAPVSISSITSTCSLAYCFPQTNNCGTTLAVGANCIISVRFRSSSVGSFAGTLAVHDNASGSPQTVALFGSARCVGQGGQCYSGHPCCPGLRCVPFSTRAFCEPALSQTPYARRANYARFEIADTLDVVDAKRKSVTRKIEIGPDADAIAITPDGKKIYVTDAHTDSVSVIETRRAVVAKTIGVGFGERPVDIAVSADGRFAYVSNASRTGVSVIDTATDVLTSTIKSPDVPDNITLLRRCSPGIVASPDGSTAYVVAESDGTIPSQPIEDGALDVALAE